MKEGGYSFNFAVLIREDRKIHQIGSTTNSAKEKYDQRCHQIQNQLFPFLLGDKFAAIFYSSSPNNCSFCVLNRITVNMPTRIKKITAYAAA